MAAARSAPSLRLPCECVTGMHPEAWVCCRFWPLLVFLPSSPHPIGSHRPRLPPAHPPISPLLLLWGLLQALPPPSAFAAAVLLNECWEHKELELAARLWDTLPALGRPLARPS